jgi:alpha-tubulin suppressor-like RCC1 family protein
MTQEQEIAGTAGRRLQPSARSTMGRRAAAGVTAVIAATAVASLPAAGAVASVAGTGGEMQPSATATTVLAWGDDSSGELGDGAPAALSRVPVKVLVPAGTRITSVRSGCRFSLALTAAGQVLAWGDDNVGQLGDGKVGTGTRTPEPVLTPVGIPIKAIRAGCDFGLALTRSGEVLAWGSGDGGELGNFHGGGTVDIPALVATNAGDPVTAISAGASFALALTRSGKVLAWGNNVIGQLGDGISGNDADGAVLVQVPKGTKVTGVAAGGDFSTALTAGGKMLAWGDDGQGELGDGMSHQLSDVPVAVRLPKGTRVHSVVDGCAHTLAVTAAGRVLAWGTNSEGQLGTDQGLGRVDTTPALVKVPAGTKVTTVSASCGTSHALTSKGQILSWGQNDLGELGNGSTADISQLPVRVKLPAGAVATSIGAGPEAEADFAIVH